MPTSRIVRLLAVAALYADGLASAGVAVAAAPVSLAGTTVVTGSRTASVLVRLPRDVLLSDGDVSVDAPRGRMTSVVLKKVGAWNAPRVETTHIGFCGEPGCRTAFPRFSHTYIWAPDTEFGLRGTLPAGTYRLYVVADGARTTATFRFRGLSGRRTITPTGPARGSVVAPRPSIAEPAVSPVVFAGGGSRVVPGGGGMAAVAVWKELAAAGPRGAAGLCTYEGKPPAGAIPAYQFPCSGGYGGVPPSFSSVQPGGGQPLTPVGPGRFITGIEGGWLLPPGEFGLGGYHNGSAPATAAYIQQLWLDF